MRPKRKLSSNNMNKAMESPIRKVSTFTVRSLAPRSR